MDTSLIIEELEKRAKSLIRLSYIYLLFFISFSAIGVYFLIDDDMQKSQTDITQYLQEYDEKNLSSFKSSIQSKYNFWKKYHFQYKVALNSVDVHQQAASQQQQGKQMSYQELLSIRGRYQQLQVGQPEPNWDKDSLDMAITLIETEDTTIQTKDYLNISSTQINSLGKLEAWYNACENAYSYERTKYANNQLSGATFVPTSAEELNSYLIVRTITRVGISFVLFYLSSVFIKLFRYTYKLYCFYDGRALELGLLEKELTFEDAKNLLIPTDIEFGKSPTPPSKEIIELIKSMSDSKIGKSI